LNDRQKLIVLGGSLYIYLMDDGWLCSGVFLRNTAHLVSCHSCLDFVIFVLIFRGGFVVETVFNSFWL